VLTLFIIQLFTAKKSP